MAAESPPDALRDPSDPRQTRVLYVGFLLVGVITVLLGPLIPELQATWGIDHAKTGSLFLLWYAASSVSSMISSFHLRHSLLAGWALASLGLAGLATGDWAIARPAVAVLGFSIGLLIPSFNLLVAELNPERRGAALSNLNLTWGVGAVSSPLLFAAFAARFGAFSVVATIAVASALACVLFAFRVPGSPGRSAPTPADATGSSGSLPLLFLIAGLVLLYVGSETSVAGWLVALSDERAAERSVISLIIGSGFWAAVLFGRAAAAVVLRRFKEHVVYWWSLAMALAGCATLLAADSQMLIGTGAVIAGLGLAPLYPLTVSVLAEATASHHRRLAGVVLACGGVGGAVLPWLAGRISQAGAVSSLSRGFTVPTAALVVMGWLFLVYRLRKLRSVR